MAAKPYRLLALVKQDAVVRVQKEPDDTVLTWPHLLTIEFFAAAMMSLFLLFMGLFINAPLEELANGNVTPAVAKAPWYFVGLQELLAYFHPDRGGRARADGHPRGRGTGARTSIAGPTVTAARPGRATARSACCSSRWSWPRAWWSPSWAPSSAARAMAGLCRGRASSSRSRTRDDRWATGSSPAGRSRRR